MQRHFLVLLILALTQITGWGVVGVLPVIAPPIAAEFASSLPSVFLGTSVLYVAMGLAAPWAGRAEIGAAWSKRSNEGRDYLSLKLDDPSFNMPIFANLFDDEDGEGFSLIWSRSRRKNDE